MEKRISAPSRTKEIVEENAFRFQKKYGQNFLVDTNILERIAEEAGITADDVVLEIGPGIGSLTQILAERAKKVIAVEIDKNLIPILQETLCGYENIMLLNQDILKVDLESLILEQGEGRPIKVVANLPYYIATMIVAKLLPKKGLVHSITVMVQKEVAERMQAGPSGKEYGILSVVCSFYSQARILMTVPPHCFMPQPKVESAVIMLTLLEQPKTAVLDEEFFLAVVHYGFGQRRKTFINCLAHQKELGFLKEELLEVFQEVGLSEKIRAEALSLEEFAHLANALYLKRAKNRHAE